MPASRHESILPASAMNAIHSARMLAGNAITPVRRELYAAGLTPGRSGAARLKGPRTRAFAAEVRQYWKHHFGADIDPSWHVRFGEVTGVWDVRFIPRPAWGHEILDYLNQMEMRPAYLDKNLSDVLLGAHRSPVTVLRRVHRHYFDEAYKPIARSDVMDVVRARANTRDVEVIVKSSKTDGGEGIRAGRLTHAGLFVGGVRQTIDGLESAFGTDFLIQERIEQHADMAAVHPGSVNTIRPVTLRWDGEIHVLLAFARFGVDGKVTDNASTGGLCCGIGPDGRLLDEAVDLDGRAADRHPTTGVYFGDVMIPNWDRFCDLARRLHSDVRHFDVVSWDFAVGADGLPTFLEMNFRGASDAYQYATRRPLFGDLTESVLQAVASARR